MLKSLKDLCFQSDQQWVVQETSHLCPQAEKWWPFDVSGRTLLLLLMWPFIAQGMVFLLRRKKKKTHASFI